MDDGDAAEPTTSNATDRAAAGPGAKPETSRCLVVAASPVNGVVVCRIIETSGLKAVTCTAAEAEEQLAVSGACVAVVEANARHGDRSILPSILSARDRSRHGLPLVVALERGAVDTPCAGAVARPDAVVLMPITSDNLGPVVLKLAEQVRARDDD